HHPTASGGARSRLADRRLADGAGDRRYRAGAATLPAGNGLTGLLFFSPAVVPGCQNASSAPKGSLRPFAGRVYLVKGLAVGDFRQCPVRWRRQHFASVPQALSSGSENTHRNVSATILHGP